MSASALITGRALGTVADFDEPKGWGTVRDERGTDHWFHCTAIADGSRTIEVGTAVSFRLAPGINGRWEAADLR